ncbi:hypothetical protein LCGC14_1414460 [marine sediment metagenome]|uniref:Uncharacterized protein n=1 Tax=marine sediment metagenome TaxID=412755 RepID=A0A0F9MV04_9ZZZZ
MKVIPSGRELQVIVWIATLHNPRWSGPYVYKERS